MYICLEISREAKTREISLEMISIDALFEVIGMDMYI